MHSPVNLRHADCLNFLDRLLAAFIERHRLGKLFREVVAVRFGPRDVFLPDLAFFTTSQCTRLEPAWAPFAPTFVAEVLSPTSADRDLGPKFGAYEHHGVQEYWIVDLDTLNHRFYARHGATLVPFAPDAAVLRSRSIPGFWIRPAWLQPENHPPVQQALDEILAQTN